jgi:hypothetical protein
MHVFAENSGLASHDRHKEKFKKFTEVFTIDGKTEHLRGFYGYDKAENDLDGIHFAKIFYNRRCNKISL